MDCFSPRSLSSLVSLLSINEGRGCQIESPTHLRSNSAWMTLARSWTPPVPNERRSLGIPKVPMSVLFAATYRKLRILPNSFCSAAMEDGTCRNNFEQLISKRVKLWGTGATMKRVAPGLAANADAVAQFAKFERRSASPGAIKSSQLLNAQSCHFDPAYRACSYTRAPSSKGCCDFG